MRKALVPTALAAAFFAGALAVPAMAQITLDVGGGHHDYDRYDRPREGRSVIIERDHGRDCHWRRVRHERPNGDVVIRRERVCVHN